MRKSVSALLCVGLLSMSMLAACGKTEESSSPSDLSPEKSPEAVQNTEDTFAIPQKTGETKIVEVTVEGEKQDIEMSEYLCTVNGKNISIYIDDANYTVFSFEGEVQICPGTDVGVGPVARVHLSYWENEASDAMAQERLDANSNAVDGGIVKIGEYDANYVIDAYENTCDVYYIPMGDDTLAVSATVFGEGAEGHFPRMLAMVGTVSVK